MIDLSNDAEHLLMTHPSIIDEDLSTIDDKSISYFSWINLYFFNSTF